MPIPPPQSEEELLAHARWLAGRTLNELAQVLGEAVPRDPRRAKGWVGEAIERVLGAAGSSLPEPDFPQLGVELKTLPVGRNGLPRESTYITMVPLTDNVDLSWERSPVRRKLARVLWVPVEAGPDPSMAERRIGSPLLWSPTPDVERVLRADFEELMDMVCLGKLERISAHVGTYLQIRPKAANGRARTAAIGPRGEVIQSLPRGFYLRASFTATLLRAHYLLPSKTALAL
jgi:DNA mismatch repair protein MutH